MRPEAMRCKSCGAGLSFGGTEWKVTCEYCGTENLIGIEDDDENAKKRLGLLKKADKHLKRGETYFAEQCYRQIAEDYPEDADVWYKIIILKTKNLTERFYDKHSSSLMTWDCTRGFDAGIDGERLDKIIAYLTELCDTYEKEREFRRSLPEYTLIDPSRELHMISDGNVNSVYQYCFSALRHINENR